MGSLGPRSSSLSSSPSVQLGPHISLRESSLRSSYIHWYQSHNTALQATGGRIYTEDPEGDFFVEKPLLPNNCCLCCNPYMRCYSDLKKVRVCRHSIQNVYEEVYRNLRWIDLPGGQHYMALTKNYLMHYIWFITYITNDVDTTNKDAARHLRYRFEDILFQAESLGITLKKLFKPLSIIAQGRVHVEGIASIIHATKRGNFAGMEKKLLRLSVKQESSIFAGNRIIDFEKISVYVRRDAQSWSKFSTLPEADKVDIVSKGLMEISENIKELKGMLKNPITALTAAEKRWSLNFSIFRPALLPHIKRMRNRIAKIVRNKAKNPMKDQTDPGLLYGFLEEVTNHYEYILRYGQLLVEELWDIILTVRMCYSHLRETEHSIMVASYDAVMLSRFDKKQLGKLLKPNNFQPGDFYKVDCPDTLRKLPVVVTNINTEVCLHLHGHRNSHKPKMSTNPVHKFSLKRWNSTASAGSERMMNDEQPETDKKKTLVFVSGEGDS